MRLSICVCSFICFLYFFSHNGNRITLSNVLYGFGHRYYHFNILYCNHATYKYYVDCCVMSCYSSDNDIDVITWHERLSHIVYRINRLAKKDIWVL